MRQRVVTIQPDGLQATVPDQTPVRDLMQRAGVSLNYPCGGTGTCGNCLIHFSEGAPEPLEPEIDLLGTVEIARGGRLACMAEVTRDCTIKIDASSRLVDSAILVSSAGRDVALDPAVRKYFLQVPVSTVQQPKSDHELVDGLLAPAHPAACVPSAQYLRELPGALAAGNRAITVTLHHDKIIRAEDGNTMEANYGIAVDIGTTTIAASLHSLRTGRQLAVGACMNPQIAVGGDVVTRLSYVYRSPERLRELHEMVITAINRLIDELCAEAAIASSDVLHLTVAGNAAMNHLFCAVPPETIALAPYTPVFRRPAELNASELKLNIHPMAPVDVLPNIGGFVGGDTVAGLLACDFGKANSPRLFIDMGTNCEVVLGVGDRLYAASAPAGPALEGGCISCGMRAEGGAITDIDFHDDSVSLQTINNLPARGICGSGLIHIAAFLKHIGALRSGGMFVESLHQEAPEDLKRRLIMQESGRRGFVVADVGDGAGRRIVLSQQDVREFQLAKAAISSTWQTLCTEAGIACEEINVVYLAGAFGHYVRPSAALALQLVPPCASDRIISVGNTALEGARLALVNRNFAREAQRFMQITRFVELAGREDFQENFASELAL